MVPGWLEHFLLPLHHVACAFTDNPIYFLRAVLSLASPAQL
jgi:hypothetical protein